MDAPRTALPVPDLRNAGTVTYDAKDGEQQPPITQMSWSNSHARAVVRTWPSSVVSRYGRSCLGAPRRFDPPAARTRPVTNGIRQIISREGAWEITVV